MTPAGTSNELDVQNEWEQNIQHNVIRWGEQYGFGEKHTVILYTELKHHVGIPTQNTGYKIKLSSMGLEVRAVLRSHEMK